MTSKPQSKSQQDTTIDSEVDPYDEIIAIFDSVNLRAKPREDILKWHHKQIAQEARAFGGCRICYGKGYATVISGLKGYADFGGDGFQTPPTTHIKYCSCDRGKQLQQLVAQEANKAQADILIWATGGIKEFTEEGKIAIPAKIKELLSLAADEESKQ